MAKNVLRGKNLLVKYKGTLIPLSTSAKITLGTNTVNSTTKEDDEDWDEVDIASHNWSISADRLLKRSEWRENRIPLKPASFTKHIDDDLLPGRTCTLVMGTLGTSFEPVYLMKGEKIFVFEPHSNYNTYLCFCTEFELFAQFEVLEKISVDVRNPTEHMAHESGLYFLMHEEPHNYPHYCDIEYNREPYANLLADLPIEAPVIIDIDGDQYTGNALITQHDLDGSVKQNQTHSLTITGTGNLVKLAN